MPIKAGFISYLNAYPFLFPFEQEHNDNWQLTIDRPAVLNGMMRSGELDLSLVSSMEYAYNSHEYFIIPHVALSSKGYVDSVKLISKKPLSELNGAHIAVTNSSASSIVILQVLLKHWNIEATFETYCAKEDIPQNFDAALTIGDEAMTQSDGEYIHSYDLGQSWREEFNRNIVFAIAIVRKDSFREKAEQLEDFIKELQLAPSKSVSDKTTFAKNCYENYPKIKSPLEYLKLLDYDLDDQRISNLQFMFDKAFEADILPEKVELNFLPLEAPHSNEATNLEPTL